MKLFRIMCIIVMVLFIFLFSGCNLFNDNSNEKSKPNIEEFDKIFVKTTLTANDAQDNDQFGYSVAISGDYAIVGAPYEDGNGSDRGAAYIYYKSTQGVWGNATKIVASDTENNDYFGCSVSISGDYVIVGAIGESDGGSSSGAAYVFHRTGSNVWDDGVKLTADDAEASDYYGYSVGISGDYVIIGAINKNNHKGTSYVYRRGGTNFWQNEIQLTAGDGQNNDYFGCSVSISGDYAIVGATGVDGVGTDNGAVYIFHRTGTVTWSSGEKISTTNPANDDRFGSSVSISGDYAIVGAYYEDGYGVNRGASYIYRRTGINSWGNKIRLIADDALDNEFFGYSVSISGDLAVVGSYRNDEIDSDAGAAYLYYRTGTASWDFVKKITTSNAEASDFFGYSVSISDEEIIIGAYGNNIEGPNCGASFIFD